jgi:hypothetical protein
MLTPVLMMLALLAALLGSCTSPPHRTEPSFADLPVAPPDTRPKFALVSWRTSQNEDAFAVFSSEAEMRRFLDNFRPTRAHISFPQLAQRLRRLPRRCLLVWMDDVFHGIEPARESLRSKVKAITKGRDIDLQFNGITTEDTGI